jgi:urease accessory protein
MHTAHSELGGEGVAAGSGSASVVFTKVGARTVTSSLLARSPLRLLTPKNHGPGAWLFTSSYGGGLVDGDELRLRIRLERGATAMVGTQAQTKVYRGASAQHVDAHVDRDATLVCLPDPVVCYAGASYVQNAHIRLEAGASLVWLEAMTCGRSARRERWAFDRYASRTEIARAGVMVARDAVLLDARHGPLIARLGRFDALATVIALGPAAARVAARLLAMAPGIARARDDARSPVRLPDVVVAPSPREDGAVARFCATSVPLLSEALHDALRDVAPLLGDDPFSRKW